MIEPLLQAERLLLHGMVDQAEELYRRTSEQDPQNAIAVVGLARVALERGADELALDHARAALKIDPENAAAIRLEARLTEVLAARDRPTSITGRPADRPTGATPRWSSTAPPEAPAQAPAPGPDSLPSERTVFARNPTMSDHRRQTERGPSRPSVERQGEAAAEPPHAAPRRGFLDRLFRRERSG